MRNIAPVDTAAIVALLNRRDRYHAAITDLFLRSIESDKELLTTSPVATQSCSFLEPARQHLVLD